MWHVGTCRRWPHARRRLPCGVCGAVECVQLLCVVAGPGRRAGRNKSAATRWTSKTRLRGWCSKNSFSPTVEQQLRSERYCRRRHTKTTAIKRACITELEVLAVLGRQRHMHTKQRPRHVLRADTQCSKPCCWRSSASPTVCLPADATFDFVNVALLLSSSGSGRVLNLRVLLGRCVGGGAKGGASTAQPACGHAVPGGTTPVNQPPRCTCVHACTCARMSDCRQRFVHAVRCDAQRCG